MKDLKLNMLLGAAGLLLLFALLGVLGEMDWCDQVILRMSQQEYAWVKERLTEEKGGEPSEREIAHWWAEHHEEKR